MTVSLESFNGRAVGALAGVPWLLVGAETTKAATAATAS
jgi:hypothetical protein